MADAERVLLEHRGGDTEDDDEQREQPRPRPETLVRIDEAGVDQGGARREEQLSQSGPVPQRDHRLLPRERPPEQREQPDLGRSHVVLAPEIASLRRRQPVVRLQQRHGVVAVDVKLCRQRREEAAPHEHDEQGRDECAPRRRQVEGGRTRGGRRNGQGGDCTSAASGDAAMAARVTGLSRRGAGHKRIARP